MKLSLSPINNNTYIEMQFSTVVLALAAAATASAGAVTSIITPTGAAPATCTSTYDGQFEITVVRVETKKRDLAAGLEQPEKRAACGGEGTLVIDLQDGQLHDAYGRTGYIASNYQFQFDKPPQAGAIYTAGFSVCGNSSIALGDSTVFYQCRSGGFYNLYNENWAPQCEPVAIDIVPCGGASTTGASSFAAGAGATPTAVVSQQTDGQPTASSAATASSAPTVVSEYTDGQPQMPTAVPAPSASAPVVSQITDGQPQAPTATIVQGAAPTNGVLNQLVLAGAALAGAALL